MNLLPGSDKGKTFEEAHKPTAQPPSAQPPPAQAATPTQGTQSGADGTSLSTAQSPQTSQASSLDPSNVATTPDPASSSSPNLIDVNLPDSLPPPLATEQIGYLHSLGLEYGWGPTSTIEWILEHVHVHSGMPWWASLIVTSLALRLSFFPLLIKQSENQARMSYVKPKLDEFRKEMMEAYREKDMETVMAARLNMKNLTRQAGISQKPIVFNVSANIVFAWCSLKLLRHMVELPVPGFLNGGAFWFTDLTVSDPYYLLPAVMAGVTYVSLRLGIDGVGDVYRQYPGMKILMLYGIPGLLFVSMCYFSSAAVLWLGSSGLVSLVGGRLLMNPSFRQRYGLTSLNPDNTAGQSFQDILKDLMPSPPGKRTIDLRKVETEWPSVQKNPLSKYQAPRVRQHGLPLEESSSQRNSRKRQLLASRRDAPGHPEVAARQQAESPHPAKPSSQGGVEGYVEKVSGMVNSLGSAYVRGVKAAGDFIARFGRKRGPELEGKEAEQKRYMERAREYERRARAGK